ncbi:hypothetical protein [Embleya sp. AB8]|uniref:hypothetical protein n=1 Tax=Embleya sp. AB8 TaxID=3156304 RepID=UPI003C731DC1
MSRRNLLPGDPLPYGMSAPRVVNVTPEMARSILARDFDNRPIDTSVVIMIAEEITRGDWQVTHQGLAFDGDLATGRLMDGQHRLRAIVKSGVTVPILVFENAPPESFSVLDTGKRRSAGDVLFLKGHKDATLLAAAVRHAHLFANIPDSSWVGASSRLTNNQVLDILATDEKAFKEAVAIGRLLHQSIGIIPTAGATGYYLTVREARTVDPKPWVHGLLTGADLSIGDPRLALIKVLAVLRRGSSVRRRTDNRAQLGLYIKAWNAWALGREARALRFQEKEKMPSPVKLKARKGRSGEEVA